MEQESGNEKEEKKNTAQNILNVQIIQYKEIMLSKFRKTKAFTFPTPEGGRGFAPSVLHPTKGTYPFSWL